MQITAKSPRVDDRSLLNLEAEHGIIMDDMYDGRGSIMDMIHEERDIECNTGMVAQAAKI